MSEFDGRDEEDELDDLLDNAENEFPEAEEGVQDLDLDERLFADEGGLGEGPDEAPLMGNPEPYQAQPVNRATMVCLRGPCIHYWQLVARYITVGADMHLKAIRQCNCHTEETALSGQNIFHCNQWWPGWLSFVPVSMRPAMRPSLVKFYDKWLRARKYDFKWKTWSDDIFESDRLGMRENSGIGGTRTLKIDERETLDDEAI